MGVTLTESAGVLPLIWRRGANEILFASQMRIIRNERLALNGTALVIKDIVEGDAGLYYCQVASAPAEINYLVKVKPTNETLTETTTAKSGTRADEPSKIWMNHFCTNVCSVCKPVP